jgi:hypothetical protein
MGKRGTRRFSHGAASAVRHIDPATIEVPLCEASTRPIVSQRQVRRAKLRVRADSLLSNDAHRRYGQYAGDRAHFQIKAGRYRI